jgi:threonine dehydratase
LATETTGPTVAEIEAARARVAGIARETPVYSSETFSRLTGRDVLLKAENLQRTGSFKGRGAVNKVHSLTNEQRAAGVVAASAGNHGQAVAWAAREAGIRARIYVPQDAPMAKVEACRHYSAQTELVGASFEEALAAAHQHAADTGATFIHPYEDEVVIAGQGTIGLELAEQVPQAETVLVPVGGGGLASGISVALRERNPGIRIFGVETARDRYTIADGIAVKQPGELTSRILDDVLDGMIDVSDDEISKAIVMLLDRTKLVVEGAGAVGVAALLSGRVEGSGPVLAVLSGGNIDPTMLISVMRHGLTIGGRYLVVRTHLTDRPGELIRLLSLVAEERGNVISVEHHREGMDIPVTATEVELTLLTRDEEHCLAILATMADRGYMVERLS